MNKNLTITEEKNKGGRPRIQLTDEQLKDLSAIAPYCTLQEIADYFGFSVDTFQRIKIRDEEVLHIYKKAKILTKSKIADSLIKKALAGDTTAAIFYMKTQGGWKVPKDDENKIKDNKLEISVTIAKNANVEKLAKFKEMIAQDVKEREFSSKT